MAEGWRMWSISLLTIMLLTLLSAAPIDNDDIKKVDAKADNDAMHSHDENVTREGKFFGHNQFDLGNINVPGSVAGDHVSIGHQVNIDVQGHTHDHHHHEDDTVIECKEGLREMFKSIDSNKDGLMDAMELLRICHQNNIQITKPLAVRILTLPDKTAGFNIAKFCELLKDCPSTNSADSIYFLLQLFDKGFNCRNTQTSTSEEFFSIMNSEAGTTINIDVELAKKIMTKITTLYSIRMNPERGFAMREDRLTRAYGQAKESDRDKALSIIPKPLPLKHIIVDEVECLYLSPENVDFDVEKRKPKKWKPGPQIPERIKNELPVRQRGMYKLS